MKVCTGCKQELQLKEFRPRNEKSKDGLRTRCKQCERAARGTRCVRTLSERFWSKVNKDGPIPEHVPDLGNCWVWTGGKIGDGYGGLWISEFRRQVSAHRISYSIAHGVSLPELETLHRCDNMACVRPDHLFLGTQRDNMQDKVRKGRDARGAKNGNATLTDEQVAQIRAKLAERVPMSKIAAEFGIGKSSVSRISRGQTWVTFSRS